MAAATTANKSPQQQQQLQQQRQQQQQQQQRSSRQQHLHLAASSSSASISASTPIFSSFWPGNFVASCMSIVLVVVFAVLLAGNCVNGQIDGYIAGEDYPIYDAVPKGLSFNCQGRQPGYYADTETRCQVWHWCLHSGHQYSFLCPNGTVFNQAVRVCDWWSNVNCASSEQLYQNNDELYRIQERSQQQQQQQDEV